MSDKTIVACSVEHTHEDPNHAYMFTFKVAAEEESGDVGQGIQSYNNMLAEMGYAPGHHDDDIKRRQHCVLQRTCRDRHDRDEHERNDLRAE